MGGKRSKNLRGRLGSEVRFMKHGGQGTISPARLNLLQEAMRHTRELKARIKRQHRSRSFIGQHVFEFQCAYRRVKTLYTRHRAATGKSL